MKISPKLGKHFFAKDAIDAFLGHLNPLSSSSVFESCLPVWMRDMGTRPDDLILSEELPNGYWMKNLVATVILFKFNCSHMSKMAFHSVQNSSQEIFGQATSNMISLYKFLHIYIFTAI